MGKREDTKNERKGNQSDEKDERRGVRRYEEERGGDRKPYAGAKEEGVENGKGSEKCNRKGARKRMKEGSWGKRKKKGSEKERRS